MAIPAPEVVPKRPGPVRSSRRSCNLTSQSQQKFRHQTLAVCIPFVSGWATSYREYISGYRYLSGGRWFVRQARMDRINVVESSSCGVNICWWTYVSLRSVRRLSLIPLGRSPKSQELGPGLPINATGLPSLYPLEPRHS